MPRIRRFARVPVALALAVLVAAPAAPVRAGDAGAGPTRVACTDLAGLRIAPELIGRPTTGAEVTAAVPVAATPAAGAHCRVDGRIRPLDPAAPDIAFRVALPADYAGRTMLLGGGGYNGTIPNVLGQVTAGPSNGRTPLARGYATYASDSGHQAGPALSRDGSFLRNEEAARNFGGDALKKTHDVAQLLIESHYGTKPSHRYVAGGSSGGREALMAVSRWPADFDGAIVLFPAWNAVALNLQFGRFTQQLARPGAYPSRADRLALHTAALQACDGLDGVRDGIISDQATCDRRFDPATARLGTNRLRCPGGKALPGCLSDRTIETFTIINSPLRLPYRLASGQRGYPGFTTWGTDFGIPSASPLQPLVVDLSLGTKPPAHPMPPVNARMDNPPYGSTFWDEWVRHGVTRDAGYDSLALDPRRPGRWQDRIVEFSRFGEVTTTDLSAFARRGGKILMAHGVHDALVSNRASRDYVARLEQAMGREAVRAFLRYYEIPGYGHAVTSQFNAEWDSLTALTAWVEGGAAPTGQIVADRAGVPTGRTRPLCEYPAWPRYRGGHVDLATSFTCARR